MENSDKLSINLKHSSFWRRFVATLVDSLILIAIGMGISMSLGRNPFGDSGSENLAGTLDYLLSFLVSTAYSVIFWVKYNGQTPGKKVMHIKVIKTDGKALDWATAVIREFSYWVSFIPLALGYFWVIFDSKKQGWHDKIANTYVVDTDEEKTSKAAHVFGIFSVVVILISVVLALLIGLGIVITCNEKGWRLTQCFANPEKLFEKGTSSTVSTTDQNKNTQVEQLIKNANLKLETANQLAGKQNLLQSDKDQIVALLQGSISDLKQATEIDPNSEDAWFYSGKAYSAMMDVAEGSDKWAIESFKKAIIVKPNSSRNYFELGGIYLKLKQYNEAIKNFQKFVELEPKNANGYYNLGFAYKKLGAFGEAKKALTKALDLLPLNDKDRYKAEVELQGL